MTSPRTIINAVADRPTRAMEMVTGTALALDGLWIMSPFYYAQGTSPLAEFVGTSLFIKVVGATYFIGGATAALLSYERGSELKYRKIAAMILFLLFMLSTFFRLLTFGIHPSGWIFNFMLALVFAINWIHVSKLAPEE